MNITLYQNNSESIVMDKELTELTTLSGYLRTGTSVVNPSIVVEDISDEDISKANYMYIEEFNRYYYIKDIQVVNNKLWNIEAHVDVLTTYKEDVRLLDAIVKRSQDKYNLYLNDGSYTVYQNVGVVTKEFPNTFPDGSYIIALAGASSGGSGSNTDTIEPDDSSGGGGGGHDF